MGYSELSAHFRRIGQLREVGAIVEWDRAVNMPDAAAGTRAASLAGLDVTVHELLAAPRVGEWLAAAREEGLLGWEQANLRAMERQYVRATAVEGRLIEAASEASSVCEQAWRRYRQENDFANFLPYLERVVSLQQQVGKALGAALGVAPYDALMAAFEADATTALIDPIFAELEAFLPEFTDRVIEHQSATAFEVPRGRFPQEAQRALGLQLMAAVGFDANRGRLDTSHHPFCGGTPSDVRITTRYDENDFSSALMGVLHEAGHAKYEQGLPPEWSHQPVGEARGMLLHESQSLLLEMQICRSREFATFSLPLIEAAFPEQVALAPAAYELDNWARWTTHVERSLIRVDADEVTYPAHVLLRYRLEKALIDGSLAVRDLPDAWDAQMRALLGVSTQGNDRDGCLQDVHWPSGAFGYFPLYTLGAMAAAQLFEAANVQLGGVLADVARGDLHRLDTWLARQIWSRASSATTFELLHDATGAGLNAGPFIRHLQRRYLGEGEPE